MTSRTLCFAATFAFLLAACGDDATGAGGSGASSGEGGSGGSVGDGGSTPASTTTGSNTTSTTTGGDGGSGAGGNGAGGGEGGAGGAGAGGAPACDEEGFVAAAEDAGELQGAFLYVAQTAVEGPTDVLQFEVFSGLGETGDREILDENYDSCDPCVILWQGCDENLENCEATYLANTGTMSIDNFEGTFSGTLDGVELIEVTIDAENVSTPVDGGGTWCLDGYGFEAPIQE